MSKPAGPVPHLTVGDAAAAIEFYKAAFGAIEHARHMTPDGKRVMHALLAFPGGNVLMLNDDFPEYHDGRSLTPTALGGCSVTLHLNLEDVDATWAQALAAGATVAMPLADQFWGDRYGQLIDPAGHRWSLATPKRVVDEVELAEGAKAAFNKG